MPVVKTEVTPTTTGYATLSGTRVLITSQNPKLRSSAG